MLNHTEVDKLNEKLKQFSDSGCYMFFVLSEENESFISISQSIDLLDLNSVRFMASINHALYDYLKIMVNGQRPDKELINQFAETIRKDLMKHRKEDKHDT